MNVLRSTDSHEQVLISFLVSFFFFFSAPTILLHMQLTPESLLMKDDTFAHCEVLHGSSIWSKAS